MTLSCNVNTMSVVWQTFFSFDPFQCEFFLQRVCIWLLADDGQGLSVFCMPTAVLSEMAVTFTTVLIAHVVSVSLSIDELIMAFNLRSFRSSWLKLTRALLYNIILSLQGHKRIWDFILKDWFSQYLLTLISLQTRMTFYLSWDIKDDIFKM